MRRRNRRKDSKTSPWKIPAVILITGLAVSIIPIAAILRSRPVRETKHPGQPPTSQDPHENWIRIALGIITLATVFEAAAIAGYLTIVSSEGSLESFLKNHKWFYPTGGMVALLTLLPYLGNIASGMRTVFLTDPQERRGSARWAARCFYGQVAIVFTFAAIIAIALVFPSITIR